MSAHAPTPPPAAPPAYRVSKRPVMMPGQIQALRDEQLAGAMKPALTPPGAVMPPLAPPHRDLTPPARKGPAVAIVVVVLIALGLGIAGLTWAKFAGYLGAGPSILHHARTVT
jgi:hypothetical protein